MYQRNHSSAKEVHRGRQQKRIGRQPLQSSSSSAAAAAAAVAAAGTEGAEAAWRGLDRVRELCWQTTDRGLMAEALAMTGWPDKHDVACHRAGGLCTGRAREGCLQHLRKGEARRRQMRHERRAQVWECVVGKTEMGIWAVGLDAARETTMRYNWKLDEFVSAILITSINVETLGTRLRISACGTWKVRTRSGSCDAKTTRKQTVWFASTAAIERGRDTRYGCVGFLPFTRICSMQWRQPKLPRSWACTV